MERRFPVGSSLQCGFTLLETLVAFTVLVLVLAALLQTYSNGTRAERSAAEYVKAAMMARSLLSQVDGDRALREFTRSGRIDGRYRWQLNVRPSTVAEPVYGGGFSRPYRPYDVTVTVRWKSGGRPREFHLETVRLGWE